MPVLETFSAGGPQRLRLCLPVGEELDQYTAELREHCAQPRVEWALLCIQRMSRSALPRMRARRLKLALLAQRGDPDRDVVMDARGKAAPRRGILHFLGCGAPRERTDGEVPRRSELAHALKSGAAWKDREEVGEHWLPARRALASACRQLRVPPRRG